MKKKLFSILFALVLMLGFSLIPAVPAVAQAPILINAVQQADGSIIATGDNFVVAYCTVTPTSSAPGTYGIYNAGFSGSIHHNTVVGGYHGIKVDSASTAPNPAVYVKIAYNNVSGFTKNGLQNGRLLWPDNAAGITADIMNNTVMSEASASIAGNGITVQSGGVGTVMKNTVGNVRYTGETWTATGILLFEVEGVTVRGNTVTSCQTGIAVGSCGLDGPANNNHIVGNTVLDADWGISLQAYTASEGVSPQTNNNKVVNNMVSHATGDIGIEVWPAFVTSWDPFEYYLVPEWAKNNKIIANSISGYATPIDDGGTKTKVHANVTP